MENPFEVEMVKTDDQKLFDEFIEKMLKGKVNFIYKKKDGSIRNAEGTLCPDLIPPVMQSKEKKEYPSTCNYWDFGANDWRAFIKDNFIGFKPESYVSTI